MEAGQHAGPGLHYAFPFLPFKLLLPHPLGYGTKVSVQGTIPASASRFSIKFQKGIAKNLASVVFSINPRLLEGPVVVRNSRIEGLWGQEERTLDSPELPFAHKTDFCMVITPDQTGYQVVVNGTHLFSYEHRMPLEDVTHLCVKGDVMIRNLHIAITLPSNILASIPNHLRPGDVVTVKGQIPVGAQRFLVNLHTGRSDSDDISLHVNPRFDDGHIVRNSRFNDAWGPEETSGGIPLTQGGSFVLAVAALLEYFKIWVNGHHLASFNHRCELRRATDVAVGGDITLSEVHIDSQPNFLCGLMDANTFRPSDVRAETIYPEIPTRLAIPGGLAPGRVLIVTAIPHEGVQRFSINLQVGESEGADVALHFNPRWTEQGPSVVLNSKKDGEWGQEVVLTPAISPLAASRPFHFVVECHADGYIINLDGRLLATYAHRLNLSNVNVTFIEGQVVVTRVLVI